jgi:hypothetical protein
MDFTDVLTEMQKTVHMPGGKSAPRLQWFDVNGKPTFTHPYVSKAVQRQLNRADREASSIQSSIVTPMTLYDASIVQKAVSRSDFQVRDLVYGEAPMSLYFKVPQPDRDRLRPLVRLMLQLIFNRLMEQLDPDRHHLLLMLDEFPELRKIPNLSAAMSLMAGYKIKPYLIAQTLTQIIDEYGPNESITDNCYIKAAFQTDNLQTCKNLSELSGNMTVEKETVNYSGQRTDFYLKHIFRSVEQVQRPLAIDDHSRISFAAILPDQSHPSAIRFFLLARAHFSRFGITIRCVYSDNGSCYRHWLYRKLMNELHMKQQFTRPYTPRTNGKAERFIQTALREWAYARSYQNSREREEQLEYWLHDYNFHRPHASLKLQTPASRAGLNRNNLLSLHS